jgi:hypothetical protein
MFTDTQTGDIFHLLASGQIVSSSLPCPPNIDVCPTLSVLETSQDLFLQDPDLGPIDLGSLFCIFCTEIMSPLGSPSPSVTD